jgi:large subunit ribosomal protein L10
LAFTKKEKEQILAQYQGWLSHSQAVFVVNYAKMNQKEIDAFRAKVRETGGQVHVVKNTLMNIALEQAGMHGKKWDGNNLFGFATDVPALAKVFMDLTKNTEQFKVTGGYLGKAVITTAQVKSLSELPPLPVVRAKLLGLFNTPASQLVRTLAEPGRQIASVLKSYSEQGQEPVAA